MATSDVLTLASLEPLLVIIRNHLDGLRATTAAYVTANFFDVLGVPVAVGRRLSVDDADAVGGIARAGDRFDRALRRSSFGAAPDLVGRVVELVSRGKPDV